MGEPCLIKHVFCCIYMEHFTTPWATHRNYNEGLAGEKRLGVIIDIGAIRQMSVVTFYSHHFALFRPAVVSSVKG